MNGLKDTGNGKRLDAHTIRIMMRLHSDIKGYNKELLAVYVKGLMLKYLNPKEFQVLRLSYGLDCDKHSAKQIAGILGIKGTSS